MRNKHLILRLEEIEEIGMLKHLSLLQMCMDRVLSKINVHVVNTCGHQFKPFGATMIYLLAESHCSCHTFWEERQAYIDLFCCAEFNHELAIALFVEGFHAKKYDYEIIQR